MKKIVTLTDVLKKDCNEEDELSYILWVCNLYKTRVKTMREIWDIAKYLKVGLQKERKSLKNDYFK